MVLASPGPLLTPPPSSSPQKTSIWSYSAQTPPINGNPTPFGVVKLHPEMGTQTRLGSSAAAAGGDGAREARTGSRLTLTRCDTPVTTRLRRGRPLTTLQPTKRQPATADAVELGGSVTTASRTTAMAAPGCSPPTTYARCRYTEAAHNAHFYNLHFCTPASLLPSGGRPRSRPTSTSSPLSDPPHQQRQTVLEDRWLAASKRPLHNSAASKTTRRIHTSA